MKIAVVGGGIFGVTIAFTIGTKYSVDLYEQNDDILKSTSDINQCRVHRGYHYPRSKDTTISVLESEKNFREIFGEAIEDYVEHYYAVSKNDSLTNADEYTKFCSDCNLEFIPTRLEIVNNDSVEIIGKVKESIFDHKKLKEICWDRLRKHNVNVFTKTKADAENLANYDYVIICTYANINTLITNADFQRDYQFEVCEKLFVKLPESFKNKSIVIMDGPFMSIDPVVGTDMFIIGDVVHTVLQRNIGKIPQINDELIPLLNKGIITNPPISNFNLFVNSASRFMPEIKKAYHVGSSFCIKTVLPFKENTDERPTIITQIDQKTITVFSGKIPSCVDAANDILEIIEHMKTMV